MPYDRPQAAEIEAILAVAEKIAKRTKTVFVVDDEKRNAFIRLSAALAQQPVDDGSRSDAAKVYGQVPEMLPQDAR